MLGLTNKENKALLIIICTVTIAGVIQFLRPVQEKPVNFDYSKSDSLFEAYIAEKRAVKKLTVSESIKNTININKASAQDLEKLPGIGKIIAQRIIDYREQHGSFTKIDDLEKVKGLGKKKINRIKNQVVFKFE